MPKFTVITICYNAEETIGKTVESVLRQTNKDYEYIIVDGASTDNTLSILNNYRNSHISIHSEPDKGISDAFNKGVAYACGEYLLFLNSGDYFLTNDVLESVSQDIKNCSEEIITFSIKSIMNDFLPESESVGKKLWKESLIPHQSSFVKREVFEKVGLFNVYLKIRMDYDFFCRCYLEHITFKCIPKKIVYYDSSGVSSTDEYNAQKEGLSIRLLYKKGVEAKEAGLIQYLIGHDGMTVSNMQKEFEEQRSLAAKHYKIMMIMNKWISTLQNEKDISQYFVRKSIRSIAVYGWGYLGQCLVNEMRKTDVKIEYMIDQNKTECIEGIKIYNWDDIWPEVDMIVVTPFYEFQKIRQKIKDKMKCQVVSIEEVISGI